MSPNAPQNKNHCFIPGQDSNQRGQSRGQQGRQYGGRGVYILSYSQARLRRDPRGKRRLESQLPPGVPIICDVHCKPWQPPPRHICQQYSGLHPIVQDMVMQDPRAQRELQATLQQVLSFLGRPEAQQGAVVLTNCQAGTHRSVTAAELLARELKSMGIEVGVRHIDRRRKPGDPR